MPADRILHGTPGAARRRHRNPELDWLRAYAVLLVVALHLTALLAPGPRVLALFFGTLDFSGGVDLFFAISGFVISGSLEPLWTLRAGQRTPPGIIRVFFLRRFWRLWPASTLWFSYCLAAAWVCDGLAGWPPVGHVFREWITALVPVFELREFLQPGVLGYYWTLSVEWQFYAVFPFLLAGLRSGRARAAALALLFGFGLWTNEISWMLRFSTLVGGIAVHALYRSGRMRRLGRTSLPAPVRLVLTPVLLAVLITVPQLWHSMLIGQLGLTLLCSILVAMGAVERGLVGDCGVPRLLGWIGLRSYSLYLCHIPVALTVKALLLRIAGAGIVVPSWASLLLIGATLLVALAMADLTYRHVELPLQRRYRPRPVPA